MKGCNSCDKMSLVTLSPRNFVVAPPENLSVEIDRFFKHLLLEELLQVDVQVLVGLIRVIRIRVFRTLVQ